MIQFKNYDIKFLLKYFLLLVIVCATLKPSFAITPEQAKALSVGETDARIQVLQQIIQEPDEKTLVFLQALSDDSVKILDGRAFIVKNNLGIDPITGDSVEVPADAQDVVSNNRMRGELDAALSALRLFSADPKLRLAAVKDLQKDPDAGKKLFCQA